MNKKRYFQVLLNPLFIVIYCFSLYQIYLLCLNGGLRRHLMVIVPLILIEGIWFLFWTIYYFILKKDLHIFDQLISKCKPLLTIELCVMIVMTCFFGYRTYQTAIPYQGHISWYLERKNSSKQIEMKHLQFYKTGIKGIFKDLNISINDDLYISDSFIVVVNKKGKITKIEGLIYNHEHSYLLDYKGQDMTVWIDNEVNKTYQQKDKLNEMFNMIDHMSLQLNQLKGQTYRIKYVGYQEAVLNKEDYYENDDQYIQCDQQHLYEHVSGYCLQIKYQDTVSCFYQPAMINESQTEEKHNAGEMVIDQSDEVTLYYNDSITYKLVVSDAALGTRYYTFNKNDEVINQDPFNGEGGQAKGIYFIDENQGFILLGHGGSEETSLYVTNDGGKSFMLQSFDQCPYVGLPYSENGKVYVKVKKASDATEENLYEYLSGKWVYVKSEGE